jgi:hypothetical protein
MLRVGLAMGRRELRSFGAGSSVLFHEGRPMGPLVAVRAHEASTLLAEHVGLDPPIARLACPASLRVTLALALPLPLPWLLLLMMGMMMMMMGVRRWRKKKGRVRRRGRRQCRVLRQEGLEKHARLADELFHVLCCTPTRTLYIFMIQ